MRHMTARVAPKPLALAALLLTACTGDEESALQISGTPPKFTAIGERYLFVPSASAGNGDALTFAITARPPWLTFDSANGALAGTPTAADVGVYRSVEIEVSDGTRTERLAPFDVEVVATGPRSATVAWQTPTENEDGSMLADLAGFEINYGRQSGSYTHTVDVRNPGIASYVVGGLVPGTYYFAMTAYNRVEVDSTPSPEVTIEIR